MEVRAVAKFQRISPRKAKLVNPTPRMITPLATPAVPMYGVTSCTTGETWYVTDTVAVLPAESLVQVASAQV